VTFTIRTVQAHDKQAWTELYAGYRAFYRVPTDPAAVETSWEWVFGGHHGITGFVAVDDSNTVVALANLRLFARPSTASFGVYLDDLFTAPTVRGRGAASALLARAAAFAEERGANIVRWITAADNDDARRVYDRAATATPWVTYDMRPHA